MIRERSPNIVGANQEQDRPLQATSPRVSHRTRARGLCPAGGWFLAHVAPKYAVTFSCDRRAIPSVSLSSRAMVPSSVLVSAASLLLDSPRLSLFLRISSPGVLGSGNGL
jgi:hypothetical protein